MSAIQLGYGWLWRSAACVVLLGSCLFASQDKPAEEPASQDAIVKAAIVEDAIVKAEKALDTKNYAAALTLLKELTAQEPKNDRVWFDLAYAHTMLGERAEAIAAYKKALELRPKLTQGSLNLGILLLEEKQAAEAVQHLEAVVAARPKDAPAHLLLADAVATSGDSAQAVEHYRKTLALDPKSHPAHYALGRLLVELKKLEEAEQHLAQAIQLRPADTTARVEMARLLERTGREEEARRSYAELVEREPSNVAVRRRLGALLLANRQYAEAAAQYEAAAQIKPSPEDDWNLARAYVGAERAEDATPLLQKLAAADPRNYDVRLLLGNVLKAQRNFPAAQKELEAAVALRPDLPNAYVDLANVLYLQQNLPATLVMLDRVARVAPETPWLHFLRAISLDKLDHVERAVDSYERFLAISHDQFPNQEFQARQRIKILKRRLQRGDKGKRR